MATKTITPNQDFKHEGKMFEKGKEYKVPVEDAEYFESAGWVGFRFNKPILKATTLLNIHDVILGHESEVN